jgi:glycosyltransferase involved in cell wall biosynthesis
MKQIIVFAEDWNSHPSSTQHLIQCLQGDVDIVWVNSIGLRRPRFSWRDFTRAWRKVRAMCQRRPSVQVSIQAAFPVIHPRVIPMVTHPWLVSLNRWFLCRQIKPYLKPNVDLVVWTSLPSAVDFYGCFDECQWWYYCGDDFEGLAGVDHELAGVKEQQLLAVADKVWVASESLQWKFSPIKTEVLSHGVDIDWFKRPKARPVDLPNGGPIAGFYGSLENWIDLALLEALAKALPHWRFVFIGPVKVNASSLESLTNVEFLGARPHSELAGYIQHWNIALLPFIDNQQIRACNPLKLREYLASGTPILSTPFPALKPYEDVIEVIESVHEATASMEAVIARKSVEKNLLAAKQQKRVSQDSWANRASAIKRQLHFAEDHSQFENPISISSN